MSECAARSARDSAPAQNIVRERRDYCPEPPIAVPRPEYISGMGEMEEREPGIGILLLNVVVCMAFAAMTVCAIVLTWPRLLVLVAGA